MKLHFIAIGGTGMGSLAGLAAQAGHQVRGSDHNLYPPMSTMLAELGIRVCEGFGPHNLDWEPDLVVVGNVCRRDHEEVLAAQARGLRLTSFPALLAELFLGERHSLVVAGTHGKTTTASLAAFLLAEAGLAPGFLIGGVPLGLDRGFALGDCAAPFVVEGDEYDTAFFDKGSKFLHYRPRTAILTSVELDHVDIFSSFEAVRAAFASFVGLIPPAAEGGLLVCHAGCREAMAAARHCRGQVETYALAGGGEAAEYRSPAADWIADQIETLPSERMRFRLRRRGETFGLFDSQLVGEHNIANTTAVLAALAHLGVPAAALRRGLWRFRGVRRRQELRGVAAGVRVIDDFAHHPTAVRETLAALRRWPFALPAGTAMPATPGAPATVGTPAASAPGPGRLLCAFEPRSATSRRATFQAEWAEAFALADEVVVADLHDPSRIPEDQRLDVDRLVSDLVARGRRASRLGSAPEIARHLAARARPRDTIAVMSSGAFGGLCDLVLAHLGDAVVPALASDLPEVRRLLEEAGLPADDVDDGRSLEDARMVPPVESPRTAGPSSAEFLLLRSPEHQIVGCVGLEVHDDQGLLRSLAVTPSRQGQGLGTRLAEEAIALARRRGCRRVVLLTNTAIHFFARGLGFRRIAAEDLGAAAAARELLHGNCRHAACMARDLAEKTAPQPLPQAAEPGSPAPGVSHA